MIKKIFIAIILSGIFVDADSSRATPSEVSSIVFEQHGCYGPCPIYRVELNATGKGLYVGKKYSERIGTFDGIFSAHEVNRLANALEKLDLEKQKMPNDRAVADDLKSTILVRRSDSEWKLVFFTMLETDELWASRMLIERFIEKNVKWVQQADKLLHE